MYVKQHHAHWWMMMMVELGWPSLLDLRGQGFPGHRWWDGLGDTAVLKRVQRERKMAEDKEKFAGTGKECFFRNKDNILPPSQNFSTRYRLIFLGLYHSFLPFLAEFVMLSLRRFQDNTPMEKGDSKPQISLLKNLMFLANSPYHRKENIPAIWLEDGDL